MQTSGDFETHSAVKLDSKVYFDVNGEISEENTDTYIDRNVIKVTNGSLDDVCHLVGHSRRETTDLIADDNMLESSSAVNSRLKGLQRAPGSYLIAYDAKLYGVIIDTNGNLKIVGIVKHVIPGQQNENKYCKVAIIAKDGSFSFCNTSDFNVRAKIESGSVFGIVSLGGYVFVETNARSSPNVPDLILILQNGYFIIEECAVKWTRLKVGLPIGVIESNSSVLEDDECIVSASGGCVQYSDGFEIFGSQSAIVSFKAFKDFMNCMQTAGSDESEKADASQQNCV